MSPAQAQAEFGMETSFRKDWETYGLRKEILELIPGEANGFMPWFEDSLLIQTKEGFCALWFYRGRESDLAFQCQLLQIAAQNSFQGFLNPLLWRDEQTYRRLDERNWLYLTHSPVIRKIHFHDSQDIRELVRLIRDFRKLTLHCGLYFGWNAQPGIVRKLNAALQQMQIFQMLAEHRIRSTGFDRVYLHCFPGIYQQAAQALERLTASAYQRLNVATTHRDRVLYDFARHNLGIIPNGQAVLLRPDKCRREVPVIDLAFCMARTGRSNGWSLDWCRNMMAEYQKTFPVASTEVPILKAMLNFPWSLYRLSGRYYFNRVNWSIPQMVGKLERLLADEPLRQQFVDQFDEFMMDEIIGCY